MEAFAVVGEADQLPFERDFGQTAQGEAPKTEHLFNNAEDRFDGLLPEFIERAAGGGRRAVAHPFGKRPSGGGAGGSGRFSNCATVRPWGSRCMAARIVRPGVASSTVVTAASLTKPLSMSSVSGKT